MRPETMPTPVVVLTTLFASIVTLPASAASPVAAPVQRPRVVAYVFLPSEQVLVETSLAVVAANVVAPSFVIDFVPPSCATAMPAPRSATAAVETQISRRIGPPKIGCRLACLLEDAREASLLRSTG